VKILSRALLNFLARSSACFFFGLPGLAPLTLISRLLLIRSHLSERFLVAAVEKLGSPAGINATRFFSNLPPADEAFGININLDYGGYLRRRALDSFQGLPREIRPETKLYLDFRARVVGMPVHSVNRYVGKKPSAYPCRTSVELQLTGWKYTGLESSYHRIKPLSPILIYTSYMRPKLITSAEPLVLTLNKKDKVFDLDNIGPLDRVEFSACLDALSRESSSLSCSFSITSADV
jgi:hypothetical protein